MKKIKLFNFWRILKFETPTLIKGAIAVIRKFDMEALHLKINSDKLIAQETELEAITEVVRTHPAAKELKRDRAKRLRILRTLNTYLSALNKAVDTTPIPEHEVVIPFMDKHIRGIASNNFKELDERMVQMLRDYDSDEALQTALGVVGISIYFDSLKEVQANISTSKAKLVKFKSEQPKMRTDAIKRESIQLLNNLLADIELSQIKYPEVDYTPLKNELYSFLSDYITLEKTRRTKSRKTALEKKTAALSGKTSAAD